MNLIIRKLTSLRVKPKQHWCQQVSAWRGPIICFVIAVVLFIVGGVVGGGEGIRSYLASLIANIASVLFAAVVALVWFERRERKRAERIDQGVRVRIKRLRSYIAGPLMHLTQVLFNEPEDYSGRDVRYLERNYKRLRELLNTPKRLHQPPFSDTSIRSRNLDWLIRRFLNLSKYVDDTLRVFGPGLIEYRALLEALEQLANGINDEWERWQDWKARDEKLLPPEALFNLSTLGEISMTAIASITLILQDWDTLPSLSDTEFSRFAPPTYWEYTS